MIGDNQNATNWAVENMIPEGNNHIDISYMKIREVVKKGEILPLWINGEGNPSDLLTKVVAIPTTEHPDKGARGAPAVEGGHFCPPSIVSYK